MGNLHPGHLNLIQRARAENSLVVVSIFVNPLQFEPNEDFGQYPRTLEQDRDLCESAQVDVIFAPQADEFLGTAQSPLEAQSRTWVSPPTEMVTGLCGRSRPHHFSGVTTVVAQLLNAVQPDRAYFGQKDAQQLAIIRRLVGDLNYPVEIVACPIVREESGLAYSSRNRYLSPDQTMQAAILYQSLCAAERVFRQGHHQSSAIKQAALEKLSAVPELRLDYLELVDPYTLQPLEVVDEIGLIAVAAYLGKTRLIDNQLLRNRRPILAIDGPAGAGKSTVTRKLAQVLGLMYLDTGAMYRALTWLALQRDLTLDDEPAVAELAHRCKIQLIPQADYLQVLIDQEDVTEAIRSQQVTANVSTIAAQAAVRRAMVDQQRAYGRRGGIVAEGRDIGMYVFPDAELKIFLTASVKERSQRRQLELQQKGHQGISLAEIEQSILLRDQKDSSRPIAPLKKAPDAIEIQTDGLSIEEVTDHIIQLYRARNLQ